MMEANKMTPQGFTLTLAVVDCLPVLFFSVMIGTLSLRLHSLLFFLYVGGGRDRCLSAYHISWNA